jgi:hypothetical protein
MLNLNNLAYWFILSAFYYWALGYSSILDYNGRRGDSTLGFLLSQGLSAMILSFFY